ncbi:MAG TPA: hypothetical protein VFR81_13960 [Longimicrobium sp.]|nr:hypothetical protein [Longimicrobium sp.]
MIHIRVTRALATLALSCAAPAAAAAQQQNATYAGIPWEMSADSFRARLDAAGMRHVRTMENGDLRFRNDADAIVMAMVRQGRVVSVEAFVPAPADSLQARYRAAVDSLRGVYGAPGARTDSMSAWIVGNSRLAVVPRAAGSGPPHLYYFHSGPGYGDELARRSDVDDKFPALEPEWTILAVSPEARYAIDTVSVQRRSPGVYRARLRIDYAGPVDDPSGRHDSIIYAADYDCTGRRTQLRSRAVTLAGRRVREDAGSTVWLPARPNTPFGAQLDHVCRYVQRRQPAAAPGS